MARPPKISNEDILTAARQVFLEQGIGASTVTIAKRAGISEASIFKRFATKQALFLAAMGITVEPDWVKALATQTPTVDIKSDLTDLCERMLSFYQEVLPRMLMLMSQGRRSRPPQLMPPLIPPPIHHKRVLANFIARAMGKGYLRRGNPDMIASMIVGTLLNTIIEQTMLKRMSGAMPEESQPDVNVQKLVRELIDTLWIGIGPE